MSATAAWMGVPGATAALAEVCDKAVGESWRPADGPVWLLDTTAFPWSFLMLLGGFGLIQVTRSSFVAYILASLLLTHVALLVFADMLPRHDIYLAQLREGCRSILTDGLNAAILCAFAAGYVLHGLRLGAARRRMLQSSQA